MFPSLLVLAFAAVAPLVHATVYVTDPVATSSLPAGQPTKITWQDDGKSPNLTAFGLASIGLYAGNQNQQTLLQTIATNVDVANVSEVAWTPDASAGPNFNSYFIRFTSNSLPDASNAQFPAEAFSAKFALTGMTGNFNASVQAEISGSGTSSSGASSTAAASSSAAGSTAPTTSAAASTVKASAAATGSSSSNGGDHMVVPRILGATGVAAITLAFFL
ncbi:hypothetical protein BJV74DRAFT_878072 [Russula compacta]|nr:hypothetical protein BJV74DRAFT_878072 [Russula compacta]